MVVTFLGRRLVEPGPAASWHASRAGRTGICPTSISSHRPKYSNDLSRTRHSAPAPRCLHRRYHHAEDAVQLACLGFLRSYDPAAAYGGFDGAYCYLAERPPTRRGNSSALSAGESARCRQPPSATTNRIRSSERHPKVWTHWTGCCKLRTRRRAGRTRGTSGRVAGDPPPRPRAFRQRRSKRPPD